MYRKQPLWFPDRRPIGRCLSAVPPPGPSIARSPAGFLCLCRQPTANSASLPPRISPKYFCASYGILRLAKISIPIGTTIAGWREETAGNLASVMEFFTSRKLIYPLPERQLAFPLSRRSRIFAPFRYLANPGVPGKDQVTGAQRRFFKICRVHRKHLPTRHPLPENLDRPHVRKFAAQTFMMLLRSRQPYFVVRRPFALVAQDQHNLFSDVYRQTSEHRIGSGRQRRKGLQHEFMGHISALLHAKRRMVGRHK